MVEQDPEPLGPGVDGGGRARLVDNLGADDVSSSLAEQVEVKVGRLERR